MTLTYNSHDLETIGACGNPEIVPFNFETTYANDAPERGAILMQQKLGTTSVAFDIGITGTAAERRAKLSSLASWLNVTEPKNLVLPDTPTWFYKAVPDGQVTTERGINGEIAHVAFTLTDPVAFGEYKTAEFSTNSPASFVVGGNYPTRPVVSAYATPSSTSGEAGLFGVSCNNGQVMDIYMSHLSSRIITIDCENRSVDLGSNEFKPSSVSRTVSVSKGTGTAGSVRWYERWM